MKRSIMIFSIFVVIVMVWLVYPQQKGRVVYYYNSEEHPRRLLDFFFKTGLLNNGGYIINNKIIPCLYGNRVIVREQDVNELLMLIKGKKYHHYGFLGTDEVGSCFVFYGRRGYVDSLIIVDKLNEQIDVVSINAKTILLNDSGCAKLNDLITRIK